MVGQLSRGCMGLGEQGRDWGREQGWGAEEWTGAYNPRDLSCALVRGNSHSLPTQGCF